MTDLRPIDDLDRALAALHDDVPTDWGRIEASRAELLAAADREVTAGKRSVRGKRRRWVLAAAAAAALVAGGSLYSTTLQGGSAEAKSALDGAAQQVTARPDPVLAAGQYRLLVTHAWYEAFQETAPNDGLDYLEETVTETWVPKDLRGTWYQRETSTGKHRWLKGSDAEARKAGISFKPKSRTASARCGEFVAGMGPCAGSAGWQDPAPEWIAGLPKDPKALYRRLKKDAPNNSRGETELLVYAQDALMTGMLPSDARATLYRALTYVHGLKITGKAVNLDGRVGTAYSSDDGTIREEVIVDPKTGEYIGRREVGTEGARRGLTVGYTSFSSTVVDGPWQRH